MTDYLSPKAFLLKHPQFVRVEFHRKWSEPDFYMASSEFFFRASGKNTPKDLIPDMLAVKNWTIEINNRQSYRIYRDP